MELHDPYLWLEDIKNPRVIRWVDRENRRLKRFLGEKPKLLESKINRWFSMPYAHYVKVSDRGYFMLIRERRSFKIKLILRDGEVIKLIDSKDLGKEAVLQWFYINREGDRLAFSFSTAGSDVGILRVIDVDSREVLDEIRGVVSDITWLDKERYYYIRFYREGKTPDGIEAPAERVFLRENGKDLMVFGRDIPSSHFISLTTSTDSTKALITISYGWSWSNVYGGKLGDPESWSLIYGNSSFIARPIDYTNGAYYILSYDDKNSLGRIVSVDDKGKSRVTVKAWRFPLRDACSINDKIVAHYIVNASSTLRIFSLDGKPIKKIRIKPLGTLSSFDSDGKEVVFKYESFFIPYRIYSLSSNGLKLISSPKIKSRFIIEEGWVKSKDETPIHMFIVRKDGSQLRKVLVYGYGGFGIGATPRFYSYINSFIEDGGVFVIANIRGGDEFGEKWHRAGMRDKKQNVFDDFIAVIKYFKDLGAKVIALGSSNGGLLVGAVLTQKPELLDGAVIGYPVLDMLRFHKLYIGKAWIPEYGNPDDPKDREFLLKYSPYHNVKKTKYPPTLVYTGLHDDRVHPGHAFKFVAKLKEVKAPVYLRTEKLSGHMGATPKTKVKEFADILAFIYKVMDIKVEEPVRL